MIAAEVRLLSDCIRLHLWKWISYSTYLLVHWPRLLSLNFSSIVGIQWSMELNEDASDPDVQRYDESIVWKRRSMVFFDLFSDLNDYNLIQIVDGSGALIQPAYDDFKAAVNTDFGNRLFFYGLKPDRINDYSCT